MKSITPIRSAAMALSLTLIATGPAAAEMVEKSFDFTDFDKVVFKGVFDVEIEVGGDAYSIDLSGRDEEMARVEVSVEEGALVFDQSRKKSGGDRKGVDVMIAMPALNGIDISGVAELDATGIQSDAFAAKLSGVGDVSLAGTCGTLDARVSGVGELEAEDLICADVTVKVSGVGEAEVHASESVDAEVSGMGEISVYGSPKDVRQKSGLFGSVKVK
ncbi:MAG: head GIN domain-containing protein [Pseudomonadota bacterium]